MSSKVVVITGASRGIGRALALTYAKKGFCLAICCHSQREKLLEVQREVMHLSSRECLVFVGDMGNYSDVCSFFTQIKEHFGKIDILINNAGISHIGLFQDMAKADWEHILSSNLNSVFYCSKQAVELMLPAKSGKILSISSVWGCVGASMEVAYSTTKGGINAFTKALAKELAPSNIQVNAIACGIIDTEMNTFLSSEERQAVLDEIPAGRMGTAEEVAELAYAINQKNDYLTGQVIVLDGGWI